MARKTTATCDYCGEEIKHFGITLQATEISQHYVDMIHPDGYIGHTYDFCSYQHVVLWVAKNEAPNLSPQMAEYLAKKIGEYQAGDGDRAPMMMGGAVWPSIEFTEPGDGPLEAPTPGQEFDRAELVGDTLYVRKSSAGSKPIRATGPGRNGPQ